MLRVIIVEDEKPILDLMERLVGQHPMLEAVGTFTSAAEALTRFGELRPDAAFLDVEMPRMGGIELAEKLKAIDEELQIVFTTAYPQYAVDAFRVSAVDYLLKPVTPDAIERVAARLSKNHALRSAKSDAAAAEEPPVRCLGTFETRGASGALMGWPTRKTEELFAHLLAYPNRIMGKWQLADLLWPDLEEERAIHNVHNTVYRLKKAFKEAGIAVEVTNANDGYHVQLPASLSDLGIFREFMGRTAAVDQWNADEAERHFRLYLGTLFGGKDYVWSTGLATELSEQYGSLARMLASHYRETGNRAAMKETMRMYLSYEPLDEDMNARLLRLYAENEEEESFRRHYAHYTRLLDEELGIAPSAELRMLSERIL
ncbi:response regulator [Cohnella silvisoli]|uniref:Response regulator n=1 Tax=Cohnella silvisoli TaxID=2873699 RepID=A0ABV1L0H5_9BACL|nr:response regulator [Cohnella silvisoli]MCD9025172.1 response regulator [Cohnella silvisoli]